jgi:hypothetical protein
VIRGVVMDWDRDHFPEIRSVGGRTMRHASREIDAWSVFLHWRRLKPTLLNSNGGVVAVGFDECDYEVGERNRKLISRRGLRLA